MKFNLIIIAIFVLSIYSRKVLKTTNTPSKSAKSAPTSKNPPQVQNQNSITSKSFALKSYDVNLILDSKDSASGTFTIESLLNPKGDEKIGWMFKFEKVPPNTFKELFVPKNNDYYLPYRIISSDLFYINPFAAAKYYQFTITDDKDKVHSLKIELPFADNKTYINDEEANLLKSIINSLKSSVQSRLNNFKKTASQEAGNYINAKPLADAAKAGDEKFQEIVKKAAKESDALAAIIKSDSEKYDNTRKEFEKIEKTYIDLRNKLGVLNEKISNNKNLRISKENSGNSFKDKKATDVKEKILGEAKKNKDSFEKSLANFTSEAVLDSKTMEDVRKSIIDKLDLKSFTSSISNVYVGN